MPDGLLQGAVKAPEVPYDQRDAAQDNAEVQPQLFILKNAPKLAQHQQIIAAEVDAEKQHEHGGHVLQVGAVAGDGIVFHAEAAGAGGAEGGADCLEEGHFTRQQEQNVQHGQQDVQRIENDRGFAHFWHQLAHTGAGAFRPEQVHGKALAVGAGGHRQQEHQHAHTAHPVGEAAPVEQPLGNGLHLRQNGGAGGGEAGDGLEKRVDVSGDRAGNAKRQSADQTEHQPADSHADHALRGIERTLCALAQQLQQTTQAEGDCQGDEKAVHRGGFLHGNADEQRRQHKHAFDQQNLGDEAPHHFVVHRCPLMQRYRSSDTALPVRW